MSSLTQELPLPQTTSLKPKKAGAPLGTVPANKSPSFRPDLEGQQFGNVMVVSPHVFWLGQRHQRHMHVLVECVTCGYRSVLQFSTLTSGASSGCKTCSRPRKIPLWLQARCANMVRRCRNPKDPRWQDYGGRGIEFRFDGPTACGLWIIANLGLPENARDLELDRIDNDGHYEPGNIRWATRKLNMANRRVSVHIARMHQFMLEHPEVRYAESTLRSLIGSGMSFKEIVERYNTPSTKPKGKFGISLIADPAIASLQTDS